jgi:hypothetical protein
MPSPFPPPPPTILPTLPLSGRQEAWGGGAESWLGPVHSRGLFEVSTLVRQRTLFAEHQEQIEQWLERETTINAAEILRRLIRLAPDTYHEGQLRSRLRRVREWRAALAERLLG